jgi:hypothetical protein
MAAPAPACRASNRQAGARRRRSRQGRADDRLDALDLIVPRLADRRLEHLVRGGRGRVVDDRQAAIYGRCRCSRLLLLLSGVSWRLGVKEW